MDLPSIKPQGKLSSQVRLEENGAYSSHNTMTDGFASVRSQICAPHPLETSEKNYKANADKMKLAMLRSAQGIHAPLRLKMEQQAALKINRLPFLPSSNIALETLEGTDEFIGFEDVLNDPTEMMEVMASSLSIMEKHLKF